MTILLINWQDRLNPQAGGAETHLHQIFGRLVQRGHQVTLLASGWAGSARREIVDGIDVHRSGGRHTFSVAAPRYFRKALARQSFDIVIEALNKVPLFTPLWTRLPTVLLVHHLFGRTAFREASLPVAGLTWLLERPLSRVYSSLPVQAISRSTLEDLVERGISERDVRVIYPGVDTEFFTPGTSAERAVEPTFLYLGRLRRYKGIDVLLHAISILRQEGLETRLIIAGKGEWAAHLRSLAERLGVHAQVEFAGFVSEERKGELFRQSWANLFPSPKEGWGITNLEAAACGTPSIASDAPGLRESVVDGVTGTLVNHGDTAAWARALRGFATDPFRVERMGAEARHFATGFTWERATDETERHLEEVVRNYRGRLEASRNRSA